MIAGEFENIATADGKDPENNDVHGEDTETVTTIVAGASVDVVKEANVTENAKVGDKITYTITVKNDGNVTLYNVKVVDEQTGLEETITELVVGDTKTFTTYHTISEADLIAGSYTNVAKAEADDPTKDDDTKVTDQDDETVTTEEVNAHIKVEKTADVTSGLQVGDKVHYTITVTNDGNVTLSNVAVVDAKTNLNVTIDKLAVDEAKT